jgi:hypothetical protein
MRAAAAAAGLALVAAAVAGCGQPAAPDASSFVEPMHRYLAARGRLCLAKTVWPIDVTQHEIDVGARNAVQMPVLERLGLVVSSVATIDVDDEGTHHAMKVRRFDLTEAGRKFYVPRVIAVPQGAGDAAAAPRTAQPDFCAATLSLDRVVGFELQPSRRDGGAQRAVVRYTYRVDAAPWTRDPQAQQVFPMVAGVVRGAGSAQLQQTFVHTAQGWVAAEQLEGA